MNKAIAIFVFYVMNVVWIEKGERIYLEQMLMKRLFDEYQGLEETFLNGNIGYREILNKAYELVWKEHILEVIQTIDLSRAKEGVLEALLKEAQALDYLYRLWIRSECNFLEELREWMITEMNYGRRV